ncbi:MAG: hypothetical protein WBN07_05650, partial [Woeseiaceae bacterium]
MTTSCKLTAVAGLLALGACTSGGDAPTVPVVVTPPPVSTPTDDLQYTVLTTRTLDADGYQSGLDAYDLIRDFGGDFNPGPIE